MGNSLGNPRKQGEVGYKKPPVETRFGQPNRNQRRKVAESKDPTTGMYMFDGQIFYRKRAK